MATIYFKNAMEELVYMKLDDMLEGMDCCKCPRCRSDIAAYMLNHLETKYVVTTEGELYAHLVLMNTQYGVDITMQMVKAVELISKNPRH